MLSPLVSRYSLPEGSPSHLPRGGLFRFQSLHSAVNPDRVDLVINVAAGSA
jgi:hypothetical protein